MKTKLMTTLIVFLFAAHAQAQGGGVIMQLGVGANYYYGTDNISVLDKNYKSGEAGYQVDAAFGFKTYSQESQTSHYVGFFGRAGYLSNTQLDLVAADQGLTFTHSTKNYYDNFSELEVGVVAKQFFRISGGYGWLNYTDATNVHQTLNYYCATTGVSLPLGPVRWSLNVSAAVGKDFTKVTYRPSTSLVFQFD